MSGFSFLINNERLTKEGSYIKKQFNSQIIFNSIKLTSFGAITFENDRLFYEDDDYIVVIDGAILNKDSLKKNGEDWSRCVIDLYRELGNEFFSIFRGTFSGLFYVKDRDECIIYTDHIGSKHLYWSRSQDYLIVSSEITDIYSFLKFHKLNNDLDKEASYMLLSYGYMLGDRTLSSVIKKLEPGHYIHISDKRNFSIKSYYKLPKSTIYGKINREDVINTIDQKFRRAVKLQFDKDKEYGYRHLVALSGGLDSRMTSWVAHDLGYRDQLNITFSQSDYLDETIPKKIAADLRHEWLFKALDNGLFIKNINEINNITGGNVLYYGLAHSNSLLKYFNFDDFGFLHSGQLGDIAIGSYIKTLEESTDKLGGHYSSKLLDNVEGDELDHNDLPGKEIAKIYNRGFNGTNYGLLAAQQYTETCSPFYDIDFLEYCLSIPIEHRIKHGIYKEWVLTKYPDAAKYIWETTGKKLRIKSRYIKFKGKLIELDRVPKLIATKLGLIPNATSTKNHMNPLDYWYKTNEEIKIFQNDLFRETISLIDDDGLRNNIESLYNTGTASEKNQALTLLHAFKLFFK